MWTPGYGLSCTNCLEPEAGPYHTSTYTLNVSSKDGCFAADSITIFIDPVRDVYVPNIFSPNDDGINDVFTIFTGKSVRQIKHLSIYSRWGELVFEQTNFSPNDLHVGWDGTFRGKALDSGVFVWQMEVEYLDEVVIQTQGDVSIVR